MQHLARQLAQRTRRQVDPGARRRAAVLVGLCGPGPYGWSTLLLVRSERLAHHAGEIAFPGGMIEPGDASPTAAALREAEEELGLRNRDIHVLGLLDDLLTGVSDVHVTPVVAVVEHFRDLQPDPTEVAGTLEVSASRLCDPARKIWETYRLPSGLYRVPAYFVPERIWGATGRIVHTLLSVIAESIGDHAQSGSPDVSAVLRT